MPELEAQNFTDKELKLSYWYVTNKLLLRKIYINILVLVSFLLWFYIIWQLSFFGINYAIEHNNLRSLVFGNNISLASIDAGVPRALQISNPVSFNSDNNRRDYYVEVSNGNSDWLATFDYGFQTSDGKLRIRKGFVFPAEQKYLMDLGIEGGISNLDITDIKWERIGNFQREHNNKYNFAIENEEFIAGAKPGDPNRLIFDIKNNSAYGYWQVGLQSFLYNNNKIVAINYIVIDQFKSGETRRVELHFNTLLPRINSTKIIPDVNIFDDDNIMPQRVDADIPIHIDIVQ
jgi:hypothetical protein